MRWNDVTSYGSLCKRGVDEPRSWDLDGAPRVFCVTRQHGFDGWFLTCHALEFDWHALKATDIDEAKAEAVRLASERLERFAAAWEHSLEVKL